MKEILISRPEYVENFQCIGSACEDHCCKQWNITIDKDTYKKYLKSEIPDIRNIAVENIVLTKKSHNNWAKIKLNEHGICSYLDGDNLCKVHRAMGQRLLVKHALYTQDITRYIKKNALKVSVFLAPRQLERFCFLIQLLTSKPTLLPKQHLMIE
ncbi:hypothetical protein GXP68_11140 [Ewingella americana]|nr:hypothetical protein GXP68_11140 [Ewingella americana]